MNDIGHNKPPSLIENAASTAHDISAWMSENPVIQSEESAREAKVFLDRGKLCIEDLESERDGKVRPLNEQVKAINDTYREPKRLVQGVIDELRERIGAFVKEEERKRRAEAEEAARLAFLAEQRAREAEKAEQEALEAARMGELGIEVASQRLAADLAFEEFKKADHRAAIAEKDSHVRIGGGFTRAISLKKKETLTVVDPFSALGELGLTSSIEEAILKSARAYRKLNGKLPEGIEASVSEEI